MATSFLNYVTNEIGVVVIDTYIGEQIFFLSIIIPRYIIFMTVVMFVGQRMFYYRKVRVQAVD